MDIHFRHVRFVYFHPDQKTLFRLTIYPFGDTYQREVKITSSERKDITESSKLVDILMKPSANE